jgi:hypothetical protein
MELIPEKLTGSKEKMKISSQPAASSRQKFKDLI